MDGAAKPAALNSITLLPRHAQRLSCGLRWDGWRDCKIIANHACGSLRGRQHSHKPRLCGIAVLRVNICLTLCTWNLLLGRALRVRRENGTGRRRQMSAIDPPHLGCRRTAIMRRIGIREVLLHDGCDKRIPKLMLRRNVVLRTRWKPQRSADRLVKCCIGAAIVKPSLRRRWNVRRRPRRSCV